MNSAREDDAALQHIWVDKRLTSGAIIFTLLFEVILGFSKIAYKLGTFVPTILGTFVPTIFVWSKKNEHDFNRCISN